MMKNTAATAAALAFVFVAALAASSPAAADPIDDWFSDVSWKDGAVQFTAKKEATITAVAAVADGKEIPAKFIKNTKGNLKYPSGATAWAGSQLMLNTPIIVPYGTTAVTEIDAGEAKVEEIRIVLQDGTTLVKKL